MSNVANVNQVLNASLRARHSAKTNALSCLSDLNPGLLVAFACNATCKDSSLVRRNGLYRFSAAMVDGHYNKKTTTMAIINN